MTTSPARTLPPRAEVVVIGGGVIGTSSAAHLADAGVDVVLLERGDLGGGSTVKSAGGVRAQFSDEVNIRLGLRGLDTFARFAELYGQDIDFHQVGYLFCLDNAADVARFDAGVALQNSLGVPSRMITPREAQELSPLISTEGLVAAAWSPTDGHCAPEAVVLGYAAAARRDGARVLPNTEVTSLDARPQGGRTVVTPIGEIDCDLVVIAAGAWSGLVGDLAGIHLPVTPLRRQIVVSEGLPGRRPDTPMTVDFSTSFYFHNEGDGVLIGMSDRTQAPGFDLSRDDAWLDGLFAAIERRAPALAEVGIRTGWAGLYEMTPDHNGLVGRAGDVVYATGFSGHGFLMGPAVGEVVRDLCLGVRPEIDVTSLSVERFATQWRPEHVIV